jgi:hypothetical protein
LLIGVVLLFTPHPAVAHGGGIDAYGGHRDNKAGNYHAHQGNCAGQTFTSKEAAIRAGCKR